MVETEAIPWRHHVTVGGGPRIWRWETPHFVVTIIGEGQSFQWEVGDLIGSSDGIPVPLTDGRTVTFHDADSAIREVVGKSYAPSLGYGRFAGRLATTFRIATDEEIDFAQFHGTRVVVTVGLGKGETTLVAGQAAVQHYELIVAKDNREVVKIQPHRIRSIVYERGGYDVMKAAHTGVSRMYRGKVGRGCTGTPGFMEDTVEHTGKKCPVHEYETLA